MRYIILAYVYSTNTVPSYVLVRGVFLNGEGSHVVAEYMFQGKAHPGLYGTDFKGLLEI